MSVNSAELERFRIAFTANGKRRAQSRFVFLKKSRTQMRILQNNFDF